MSQNNPSYPSQIKYIVGNEAAERFSYYGMRSILVVFMTTQVMMQAGEAEAAYHYFVAGCYLLPLLGAYLSDRYLGKYRTIMALSLVYCAGHAVLALFETKMGMYAGLSLIALGSGGIKPCVSAHVGDQFDETNKSLLKNVFDLFYWSINFGSFFSTLLIPVLLTKYGASVAFGVPGILMGVATFVFWMGRNEYVHVPPNSETGAVGFTTVVIEAAKNRKKAAGDFFEGARAKYSFNDVEGARAAWGVMKVFATVSIFWALYDQSGSSWVLQAEKMNLDFMGIHFEASQIQAINPILVMLMIPMFSKGIYPGIEKIFGFAMTPLRRMSGGMILAASSFVGVALIQSFLDAGIKLNVAWQFIPFFLLTASEVMVSITGLEFAYTQAPRSMKSTLMSFWLLTVFVGNMFTGYISQINVFQGATYFYFFAILMAAVSVIFVYAASRYKVRNFIEGSSAEGLAAVGTASRGTAIAAPSA